MADLNDDSREGLEIITRATVKTLAMGGQSLAIAREAMINAFDEAAEKLEA